MKGNKRTAAIGNRQTLFHITNEISNYIEALIWLADAKIETGSRA
jgi:hypothetical protein